MTEEKKNSMTLTPGEFDRLDLWPRVSEINNEEETFSLPSSIKIGSKKREEPGTGSCSVSRRLMNPVEISGRSQCCAKDKCSRYSKVSKSSKIIEEKLIELESEKMRIELIESKMKILELQKQIKLAEIQDASEDDHFEKKSILSKKSSEVQKWVDDITKHSSSASERYAEMSQIAADEMLQKNTEDNNISKLCNTIANAIKQIGSSNNPVRHLGGQGDFILYDGKPENWPLFLSHFQRTVSACGYNNEEIMLKLQKCLRGEAFEAVKSIMLHPKNVDLVLKTLELRFGRPEFIIDSLFKKVQSFPNMKENDFEMVIKLSCNVDNLVATLEHLEMPYHLHNPQLVRELVSKIPNTFKMEWGEIMQAQRGNANLKHFAEWLNRKASAACYVSMPNAMPFEKSDSSGSYRRKETVMVTKKLEEMCWYCKIEHHIVTNCPEMKNDDIDTRWKRVVEEHVCFTCLKKGHRKKFCQTKKKCGVDNCQYPHHELLHNEKVSILPNTKEALKKNDEEIQTVCLSKDKKTTVLLRMLPVKLQGPNREIEVHALFDEGSTISLIDADIAKALGLEGEDKPFCMQWATDTIQYNNSSKTVDLKISGVHQNARIFKMTNVRTIDKLSLPRQTVITKNYEKYSHLQGLPIKDMVNAQAKILIGQDYIHLTVPRKICHDNFDSPMATKSHLGWVLHGRNQIENEQLYNLHISLP